MRAGRVRNRLSVISYRLSDIGCRRVLLCVFALMFLLVQGMPVQAAPYVLLSSGKKIEGSAVEVNDAGQILLKTERGVLTFPKGTQVFVDKPAELEQARKLIEQRQYARAMPLLRKIIKDYRLLRWDVQAKALLGRAHFEMREYAEAAAVLAEAVDRDPDVLDDDAVRESYMRALHALKQFDKLKTLLDETIMRGSRKAAAMAQLMRGDLKHKEGAIEPALFDYMRTADFFKAQEEYQAEANFKTAECLEKLGDERAAEYYAVVAEEYPSSTYGAKAKLKAGK